MSRSMPRSGQHRGRGQLLGLPEHQVRERQRVDAHVEQGARAERRVEHPVVGAASTRNPSSACSWRGVPNVAVAEPRCAARDHRVARRPHRLHQEAVVLARPARTSPRRRRRAASAASRRARACRPRSAASRARGGSACGRGDVDDVDGRVGDQLLVGAVRRARRRTARRTPAPASSRGSRPRPARRRAPARGRGRRCGRSCRARGCPSGWSSWARETGCGRPASRRRGSPGANDIGVVRRLQWPAMDAANVGTR